VKVNTAIIGGIILDVGEKTIDLSVASRLNKFDGALNGKYTAYSYSNVDSYEQISPVSA
jgi:hypothetical protein